MIRLLTLSVLLTASVAMSKAQYAGSLSVETLLKTDTTSIGQPIVYPRVNRAEVTLFKITMPPGSTTGWHKHKIPLFAYVVQGTLTVARENHAPLVYQAGEAVSEMIDVYHEGVNKGDQDVILIACYLGGDAKPLVVRKPEE